MYLWASENLCRMAGEMSRQAAAIDKAVSMIRKVPGWQKLIKTVWPQVIERLKGQGAKEAGPRELIISGLIALLSAMNIDAQEASKPGALDKVMQTIEQQKASYTQADVDRMAEMIPFNLGDFEKGLLEKGTAPLRLFKYYFSLKIKGGLKDIKNKIMSDKVFSSLSSDQLSEIVGKGLVRKMNDPQYKIYKDQLIKYLKDKGQDMSFLELLARTNTKDFIEKDKDLREALK